MRLLCALALAFSLGGCSEADWSGIVPNSPASVDEVDPSSTVSKTLAIGISDKDDGKCRDAAKARANDADVQDFDTNIQHAVYEQTYAECLHWAKRSGRR